MDKSLRSPEFEVRRGNCASRSTPFDVRRSTFAVLLVLVLAGVGGCTADPAGNVSPLAGTLCINEFMASNASSFADEHGDYDDWVELYNAGTTRVVLRGMYLTDDLPMSTKWPLPDTSIPAGGYLVIWADGEIGEGPLHASFKLNADPGEQLGLYSTEGARLLIVDTLSFGRQRSDTSYGRIPDAGPDWRFLATATPGKANRTEIPPLRDVLFINEFMASNATTFADEAGDYDDWVEVYNAGSTAVSLAGLYLTDNLAARTKWPFPDTVVPARGFLVVWADNEPEEGPLHATFNLAAAVGEELGLFQVDSPHVFVVDTLSFGPQRTDTSWGRYPDASGDWQFMPRPTPRAPNRQ